eukprot:TRINITY_DN16123_c0_g1_i2.p1 TRINITY_DN16123_c0_g1~~TRINITY_DN16123_c0_g1_i2.p1  ORF type:complete len:649 (+),score=174.03 TRINITY_DN16123_c0_g1_i2:73-2019(+)
MLQTVDGRFIDMSEKSREITLETRSSDKKRQQLQKIGSDATEKKEMMLAMLRDQTDVTNATSSKVRCLLRHLETVNQLQNVDPSSGITYENRIKFLEVELQSERQSNIAMVRELQEQHTAAIAALGAQVSESSSKLTEECIKKNELVQSLAVITSRNTELTNSQESMEHQISELMKDIKYAEAEKLNLNGILKMAFDQVEKFMESERMNLIEKEQMMRCAIESEVYAFGNEMEMWWADKRITDLQRKEQMMLAETNLLREAANEHSAKRDNLLEEVASLRSARQEAETRCMVLETSLRESQEQLTSVSAQSSEQVTQIITLTDTIKQKDDTITSTVREVDSLKADLSNHETLQKEGTEYINQLKQSLSESESKINKLEAQLSQEGLNHEANTNQVKVLTSLQASLSEKLISSMKEKDDVESKNCEARRDLASLQSKNLEKEEEIRELHRALLMSQRLNTAKDSMIEQADSEAAAARQTLAEWKAQQVLNQVEGIKSPLSISDDSNGDDEQEVIPPADPDECLQERQDQLRVDPDNELMATPRSLEGDYEEDFVPCSPIGEDVQERVVNQPDRPSEILINAHSDDDLGITHYGCNIILVTEGSLADGAGVKSGDVISSVDGTQVETKEEVNAAFRQVTGSYQLVVMTMT